MNIIFSFSRIYDLDDLALDYLDMVVRYPGEADLKNIRSHLHKFLHSGLKVHTDLRDKLSDAKSLDTVREVALEMKERRLGLTPLDKITWYYRYWPSMKIERGETSTFIFDEWDEQIAKDPLFNKKLRDQEKKKTENVVNNDVLTSGAIDMDLGGFLEDNLTPETEE